MAKKARPSLYLEDEELKRQIKVAAAKRGVAVTDYCAEAIAERLIRDGERSMVKSKSRNANREKLVIGGHHTYFFSLDFARYTIRV